MTKLPVAIGSALLLHAPAAGAFVLHRQHPAVLVSFSSPTDGTSGATSALSVKEDVTDAADAVTIEIIESDLDASTFLAEMEEEIEGVAALKEAAGIGTLIPIEAKVGDMYTRAIAKMEAMAWKSISRHQVDMEEFNNEIDVAIKNELHAEARKNGPLVAFSFLGLAIAIALVVTAPDL